MRHSRTFRTVEFTLYALALLLGAFVAHTAKADDCTVASYGTTGSATANVAMNNWTFPGTYTPGDAILIYAGAFTTSSTTTADPSGYERLLVGDVANTELWCKIAGIGESVPSMTWDSKAAGFITALHNTDGFKDCSAILGDHNVGHNSSASLVYGALTVTQGGNCATEFAMKQTATGNTNFANSVNLTSGFTKMGFGVVQQVNGVVMQGQLYNSDATTPDLVGQSETINTNSDVANTRWMSATFLAGDKIPTWTPMTPETNATATTLYTHGAVTPTGYDNWTDISVTGSGCQINVASRGWLTTTYINEGESFQTRGTSGTTNTTLDCVVSAAGGAFTDTYSITVPNVSTDTDIDTITWTDKTAQEISAVVEAAEKQCTGIDAAASIALSGTAANKQVNVRTNAGTYDEVSGWASSGECSNTDWIKVRGTSSGSDLTALTVVTTIGSAPDVDTFSITTGDTNPVDPTFTDLTNQTISTEITGECETITGLTAGAAVTVTGGTAAIATPTTFSASPGLVHNNECIYPRGVTSGSPDTPVDVTINVGVQSDIWTIRTAAGASDSHVEQRFKDTCTDTNGDDLQGAHTPDVDIPAHGWVTVGSGGSEVQSNKCQVPATTISYVDIASKNGALTASWTTGSGANSALVVGRLADSSNYYRCRFIQATGIINLDRVQTTGATLATTTTTFTSSHTYKLGIQAYGDLLACALDGVKMVSASDSVVQGTGWGIGTVAVAAALNFDDIYIFSTHSTLNSSGRVPDDPFGMFRSLSFGVGSFYSVEPTDQFAQHVCSAFDGGSLECDMAAFTGTDTEQFNIFDTTSSTFKTLLQTIDTGGAGTVAPVMGAIANQTCEIGTPITPIDVSQYLTTLGQPAATYDLPDVPTHKLPDGLVLSVGGAIIGTCTTAGTFSPTIRATNATGNSQDNFSFVAIGDDVVEQFHYTDISGQTVGATAVSTCEPITGVTVPVSAVMTGDTGCAGRANSTGSYTSPIALVNNDCLQLHVTVGSSGTTESCTATIGSIFDAFDVAAAPIADTTPDEFSFPAKTGVARSTVQRSQSIAVSGLADGVSADVTISNGLYYKNGVGPTAAAGTVVNDDVLEQTHTSAAGFNEPFSSTLCVDTFCAQFTTTTLLGTLPTCDDIPTQTRTVGVAIDPVVNLAALCVGATSFGISETPTGVTQVGSVFSGVPTVVGEFVQSTVPVSNDFGTLQMGTIWNIVDVTAESCHDETLHGAIVHDVVLPLLHCEP